MPTNPGSIFFFSKLRLPQCSNVQLIGFFQGGVELLRARLAFLGAWIFSLEI
jgi:hypothetical protein